MFRACASVLAFVLLSACASGESEIKTTAAVKKNVRPDNWVVVKSVKSSFTKLAHSLIIYLPKDYGTDTNARYPVLYAHDGQNLFDPSTAFGGSTWKLDRNIEELQAAGLLGKIIVVGVYNNAMRVEEYTPYRHSNQYVNNQGGQLSNYGRVLVEELKPWVDSNYRTLPDRGHTFVMGSSLGGLASFYLLAWYTNVFGGAACVSPSFWWSNNQVERDVDGFSYPDDVKIYMDGGWKEDADESQMAILMRGVREKLLAKGLKPWENLYYYEDPMGSHNENFWAARGKYPLLFLFGAFNPEILGVKPLLLPNAIGMGETSFAWGELTFGNGLKGSVVDSGLVFEPASVAGLSNGILVPKAPGNGRLTLTAGTNQASLEVNVLSRSHLLMDTVFRRHPGADAVSVVLTVSRIGNVATNLALPMQLTNGEAVLNAVVDMTSIWTIGLKENGKVIADENGKPCFMRVQFRKSRTNVNLDDLPGK